MTHKETDADFVQQVAILNLVIVTQISEDLAPYEVNATNYFYVMKIGEEPGITKSVLNQLVYLNSSTITRAVNQLTKKGLIKQVVNPNDRRATQLYLTEKGTRLNRGIDRYIGQLNTELMNRLAPNDEAFFKHIVQLRQSIETDRPKPEK